jgi:CBS domain containing-hemolysin-like protein
LIQHGSIDEKNSLRTPIYVLETSTAIKLIETLRHARGQIVLVSDEFGLLKGIVSPIDILEAIAGEFPDEDETLEIQQVAPGQWTVVGSADLHQLELALQTEGLVSDDDNYTFLAGFLMAHFGRMPEEGELLVHNGFEFIITKIDEQRIASVSVRKIDGAAAVIV